MGCRPSSPEGEVRLSLWWFRFLREDFGGKGRRRSVMQRGTWERLEKEGLSVSGL